MPDISVRDRGRACGRGHANAATALIVAHGGGWETQYCHHGEGQHRGASRATWSAPASGSGSVGMSGLDRVPASAFHASPATARSSIPSRRRRAPGTCGDGARSSLWDASRQDSPRLPSRLASSTRASRPAPVTMDVIDRGEADAIRRPGIARARRLRAGDRPARRRCSDAHAASTRTGGCSRENQRRAARKRQGAMAWSSSASQRRRDRLAHRALSRGLHGWFRERQAGDRAGRSRSDLAP